MSSKQVRKTGDATHIGQARWSVVALSYAAFVAVLLLGEHQAVAVPSFARQTGMACAACHTVFPELTPFGREFKLNGYVISGLEKVQAEGSESAPALSINRMFPLSMMFQTSLTRTDSKQPGTQNGNVEFPQQLSLFLAGQIAPHLGTFLQATYNGQDDHFSLDNTDIRYADVVVLRDNPLQWGVTLNNNPTVEDLWNSTPAWGYPFAAADSAPVPIAQPLLAGALAQQVGGIGAYGLWNHHLYANATIYRSAHIGSSQPPIFAAGGTIKDVAPYWRLAWQQNLGENYANYFEVGTLGMYTQMYPECPSDQQTRCVSGAGAADKYTDVGMDLQYERALGSDSLSAHALYIYEDQQLDASYPSAASNHRNHLNTLQLNGIYHYRSRLAAYLQYFLTRGSSDQTLYGPPPSPQNVPPVDGSSNGNPASDGVRMELAYYPWENVRVSGSYTVYTLFNGRAHDYNGYNRSAYANNTFYLLIWLVY